MALIRFSGRARRTVRALLPILFIIVSGGHLVAQVGPVAKDHPIVEAWAAV